MKREKESARQTRLIKHMRCSRFEERDFLDYLKHHRTLPTEIVEVFEKHIEDCDECAARLARYSRRLRLWCENEPSDSDPT